MQYYILDTSYNWADEMDINAYTIMSEETLNQYKEELAKIPKGFYYIAFIGTNEEQEFNVYNIQQMLNTAQPISKEEVDFLNKYVHQCNNDPINDFFEAYNSPSDEE